MKQIYSILAGFVFIVAIGCSTSPKLVSERSVDEKLASVVVGQTTLPDVQAIFGPPQLKQPLFWVYNISDTEPDFIELKAPIMGHSVSPLPFGFMTDVPTNTRALVTVRFNDAGIVKSLEVARYFSRPYVQEYWYLANPDASTPLDQVAKLGENNGFKIDKDSTPGTVLLQDPDSKAKVSARIEGPILHITSSDPYDRLSIEYRVSAKRETALMENVSASDLVQ